MGNNAETIREKSTANTDQHNATAKSTNEDHHRRTPGLNKRTTPPKYYLRNRVKRTYATTLTDKIPLVVDNEEIILTFERL